MSNKQFCTIEYLDKDGNEIIDHAVLSVEEQMKLMNEFINHGAVATIHEHVPNVQSLDEEKDPVQNTNID